MSVQLLNGFRVTHVPTKQPCNADILQSQISRVITCGTPFPLMQTTTKSINIMTENSKNGRPPSPNRCTHCVMVRFDDLEWDALTRMMEKADEIVRATFIKRLVFGKPFKVLTTDRSLAVYCAKLSEFFAQYRTVGVNYDLVVKELRTNFTEKKAMTLLYKLEKATIEMAKITADVRALSLQFDEQWSLKSR